MQDPQGQETIHESSDATSRRNNAWLLGCAGGSALLVLVTLAACVAIVLARGITSDDESGDDVTFDIRDPQQPSNPPDPEDIDDATLQLATEVLNRAMVAQNGFVYTEDVLTFGLLLHHLNSGEAPSLTVADTLLTQAMQLENISSYRAKGYRAFWYSHIREVNWQQFPFRTNEVLGQFDTYLLMKSTARRNALNQQQAAIVGSEEAWRNAMSDWQAFESSIRTREQIAEAENEAFRTMIDADAAVQAAAEVLGQNTTP